MTAVSLFDALADAPAERRVRLAERLVAAALADLDRLREDEQQFARDPADATDRDDPARDLEVLRTVWRLYAAWADDADQVLARAGPLVRSGAAVAGADRLDDAVCRVRARLSVSPEQTARAKDQVRQGQVIPARELRDELHARLRA